MNDYSLTDLATLVGVVLAWIGCLRFERFKNEALQSIGRSIRLGVLPAILGLDIINHWAGSSDSTAATKLLQTVLTVTCLWVGATALKGLYFLDAEGSTRRASTPRLLIDIVRLAIVSIGGLLLTAQIWNKDLSPLLTTFGVGSLVLGLALQDTLGNLFSGLSLVSERPFSVGDWIQAGEISGKVLQVNWRAVRIQTRELDEITIPNSALSKDRIINFSRPSLVSGVKVVVGFEYDAPPNFVREMLLHVAHETSGILHTPPVDIRVIDFAEYAIKYEVRFFISDLDNLPQIRSRFMTQLWYAARRAGVKVPFPIRSIFKTEIPPEQSVVAGAELLHIMKGQALFGSLTSEELQVLSNAAKVLPFAAGEVVIRQADDGQELYIVLEGVCVVTLQNQQGGRVTLAHLKSGDTFGEMSVLAGEPRSATVSAETDVRVARISRDTIRDLLQSNSALQSALVSYIAKRSAATKRVLDDLSEGSDESSKANEDPAILARLRRFFGL